MKELADMSHLQKMLAYPYLDIFIYYYHSYYYHIIIHIFLYILHINAS